MIDLDELAEAYVDTVDVPPGEGVVVIMAAGDRRRRRRSATSAGVALCTLAVLGFGLTRIAEDSEPVQLDVAATTTPTVSNPLAETVTSFADAFDERVAELPLRDDFEDPILMTPALEGWDVEMLSLELEALGGSGVLGASYSATRGADAVRVDVIAGNVDLGPTVETFDLDRPSGPTTAWVETKEGGVRVFHWNEISGNNFGTAVRISANNESHALEVAASIEFTNGPYVGPLVPTPVALDPDRAIIAEGIHEGVSWQIVDNSNDVVVIIDGLSPVATTMTAWSADFGADLVSVSLDGLQINLVRLPLGGTADVVANGERIPMPSVDHDGLTYAVAPIPAGRVATMIEMTVGEDVETLVLPLAPTRGWSTFQAQLTES